MVNQQREGRTLTQEYIQERIAKRGQCWFELSSGIFTSSAFSPSLLSGYLSIAKVSPSVTTMTISDTTY